MFRGICLFYGAVAVTYISYCAHNKKQNERLKFLSVHSFITKKSCVPSSRDYQDFGLGIHLSLSG